MNLRAKEVKLWYRIGIRLGAAVVELKDQEIIEMFWNKDLSSVLKEATYIVILQLACDKSPFTFGGETIGLGGEVGFTVHKLKNISMRFHLRFQKSTAFKVYDDFVEKEYVKAIKRQKGSKTYTLYSITDKGRKASQDTLETLQDLSRIQNEYKRKTAGRVMFVVRPEEWDACWKKIGKIWGVTVTEELLSTVFTQIII